MRVLGIDPGYGRCGFAVVDIDGQQMDAQSFGVIKTKSQTEFAPRLLEIAEDFEHLLKKYSPEILSIEDLFFVDNVTTGMGVAQVRGVLIYLAHKSGLKIIEPKPVEVKQVFTGNGRANKTEMQKMARIIFGLEKSPKIDDAADALAVAFFAGNKIY